MTNFETVEVKTDLLIIGGGFASCGAATEACYWAKKNGLKVTVVDKASLDRSGAVAMGLSAINQYIGIKDGENTPEEFVRHVRHEFMGISRDDLVLNIARHVDSSVHLFEKWGLKIWTDEQGKYIRGDRWQVMINGESYKILVAEAAKNAIKDAGGEIYERVFIVEPLIENNTCVGAVGFSTRDEKFYVFKAKATIIAAGGAVHVFKPKSTGEGFGRSWYPPFSAGASAYFCMKAGAEMTCQEIRYVPLRLKDAQGPVMSWMHVLKSRLTNSEGKDYMADGAEELKNWAPYGIEAPVPTNLQNYLSMKEQEQGRGPLYMETNEAIQKFLEDCKDDPKALKKKTKDLESNIWEDFLEMTISQAQLWAAQNIKPEETHSEIGMCEPYFTGSYSGASGAWVSGPDNVETPYKWGYSNMTTVNGLFAAGDASGASSHKYSSGSHAEGRIAGKAAVKYILEKGSSISTDGVDCEELKTKILSPIAKYEQFKSVTTEPSVNPNYLTPRNFLDRLQKIMDEYAGGVSANFKTNKTYLERGLALFDFLKEDSEKLAAGSLYDLERCWENIHRMWQGEAHIRTMLFREETRWPGYYFRSDTPTMDETSWHCFANSKWDPATGEWTMCKRDVVTL